MCGAVGQCDGNEGMAVALKMDVPVLRCGNGQEMREKELQAAQEERHGVIELEHRGANFADEGHDAVEVEVPLALAQAVVVQPEEGRVEALLLITKLPLRVLDADDGAVGGVQLSQKGRGMGLRGWGG